VATARTMIIAISHMLSTGPLPHPGTDYYTRRTPDKLIRRKITDLEVARHIITKTAA
jgi:hypothetical protein